MSPQIRKATEPEYHTEIEHEDEIDLTRWIEAFRRRRRLLAIVVGSVVVASILLYVITPKQYQSSTTVQIERRLSSVMSMDDLLGVESYADAQTFYPTQYKLLESRGLAERVIADLHLAEDQVFNPSRGELLGGDDGEATTGDDDERSVGSLANQLLNNLSIKPVRNTRLVEIAYRASSPELSARVANGVAESYIDWGIELRSATVGRASSFLASQIEGLKEEIQDKESQLQAYSRRTDIVALDPNSNVVVQRLEALNQDYTAAVSSRIEKEAEYYGVVNAPKETVADTFSAGLVAQLRRELLQLEQEYARNLNTYKPEWPAMQELKANIDKSRSNVQSTIDSMVTEAREGARNEYQTALRREQSLAAELTRQKAAAMQLNSAAVEYNNLRVEVSTRRQLLDDLLRKQSETGVADRMQGTRSSNVVVVDRALVPNGPYRPSLPRNLALGLVLGLMLGVGAVLIAELLDRSLHTPEDVERILGLPVLGVIPDMAHLPGGASYGAYGYGGTSAKKKKGRLKKAKPAKGAAPATGVKVELLPHEHPRMAVAEAYRTVRSAVLLSSAGGLQSVVVTSAMSGEGKTSIAANLAVVLAQLGREVLLVDTDMRKPRQHEVFKVSNRRGLVNHLAGDLEPSEVIGRTGIPNLCLVPAGPSPPNPSELLSSQRMREFADLVTKRFDFVVYDSPPVLPVTDASVLGTLVDGAILCVAAGQAARDDAAGAMDRMQMGQVRMLGAVLNKFRAESEGYRGYRNRRYMSYGDDQDPVEGVGA